MYLERDRLLLDYKYFLYEKSLDYSEDRSSKTLKVNKWIEFAITETI